MDFVFFRALLTWTTRLKKQWRTLPVEFVPQKTSTYHQTPLRYQRWWLLIPFSTRLFRNQFLQSCDLMLFLRRRILKKPAFLLHTFKQKIMQAYSWDIILLSYILSQTHKRLCPINGFYFIFTPEFFKRWQNLFRRISDAHNIMPTWYQLLSTKNSCQKSSVWGAKLP